MNAKLVKSESYQWVVLNANFIVVKLYYSYARGYHWGKLGEWYSNLPILFLITECKPTMYQNKNLFKNPKY